MPRSKIVNSHALIKQVQSLRTSTGDATIESDDSKEIDESTSSEISCGETLWTLPIQRARSEAVGSSSSMKQQRAVDKHRAHQASLPCMADELELCAGAIEEEQWRHDAYASGGSTCTVHDTYAFPSPAYSTVTYSDRGEGKLALSKQLDELHFYQQLLSKADCAAYFISASWPWCHAPENGHDLGSAGGFQHGHKFDAEGHCQVQSRSPYAPDHGLQHRVVRCPAALSAPGARCHVGASARPEFYSARSPQNCGRWQQDDRQQQQRQPQQSQLESVCSQGSHHENTLATAIIRPPAANNQLRSESNCRRSGWMTPEPWQQGSSCSLQSGSRGVNVMPADLAGMMMPVDQHPVQPLWSPHQCNQYQSESKQEAGNVVESPARSGTHDSSTLDTQLQHLQRDHSPQPGDHQSPTQPSRRGSVRVALRQRLAMAKSAASEDDSAASESSSLSDDGIDHCSNGVRTPGTSKRSLVETDANESRPDSKIPRCVSVASVTMTAGLGRTPQPRRAASARAAAKAAASTLRKARGSGGRGTGPIAYTLPGQHCCNCGTQVTPVWRAGPSGPKTLCNACGVRYMKTVKPRR